MFDKAMAEPTFYLALTAEEAVSLSIAASWGIMRIAPEIDAALLAARQKLFVLIDGIPRHGND